MRVGNVDVSFLGFVVSKLIAQLDALLLPVVEGLGYELWHLELEGRGNDQRLRIYIDTPAGIGLEDCEKVSREVSATLDVEDVIPSAYHLEVSSPGWDRVLVKPAHFQRFMGEQARVTLFQPVNGGRRWKGVITAVEAAGVRLQIDAALVLLEWNNLAKARLEPPELATTTASKQKRNKD